MEHSLTEWLALPWYIWAIYICIPVLLFFAFAGNRDRRKGMSQSERDREDDEDMRG